MKREQHMLPQAAVTVVRHLARERLEQAQGAASRLDTDDPEALHDFRVATRRLRTLLRAYAELELAPRKALRRLRKLSRATNEARDLEVALASLAEQGTAPAALLVQERLVARYRRVRADTVAEVTARWPAVADRLHRALDREPAAKPLSFRACTAHLIAAQQAALQELLAELRSEWQDDNAHRARLSGKRLRYLLEPIAAQLPPAAEAVASLKQFQDRFGRYHDLWVLLGLVAETAAEAAALSTHARVAGRDAASTPVESYLALADHLRAERRQLAAELRRDYLDAPAGLFPPIQRTLEALATP